MQRTENVTPFPASWLEGRHLISSSVALKLEFNTLALLVLSPLESVWITTLVVFLWVILTHTYQYMTKTGTLLCNKCSHLWNLMILMMCFPVKDTYYPLWFVENNWPIDGEMKSNWSLILKSIVNKRKMKKIVEHFT
jgi:hypothetical protein